MADACRATLKPHNPRLIYGHTHYVRFMPVKLNATPGPVAPVCAGCTGGSLHVGEAEADAEAESDPDGSPDAEGEIEAEGMGVDVGTTVLFVGMLVELDDVVAFALGPTDVVDVLLLVELMVAFPEMLVMLVMLAEASMVELASSFCRPTSARPGTRPPARVASASRSVTRSAARGMVLIQCRDAGARSHEVAEERAE